MVLAAVKVFARIKKEPKFEDKLFEVRPTKEYEDLIFYNIANFRFCKVFKNETQNEVFDTIAKPVVTSVLQGYNGTIFAYGQTGSGKTYSMTGCAKKYENRGLIPRSLEQIFAVIEKTDDKPTIYISYIEIYKEICYDLLNPRSGNTAMKLEELSRVTVLEDRYGGPLLKNVNVLPVKTEEEAMRLLFLGDTNSSERVYKSKIVGNTLQEAKNINLSLHHMQQVIFALSEPKRSHIPYRNSILTFILKDSIAGNCLSVMLATLSASKRDLQETISTCKFAQKVSLIKTSAVINEVTDPYQKISILEEELHDLRSQLLLKNKPKLIIQKNDLITKLDDYLKDSNDIFDSSITSDLVPYCFGYFKGKIKSLQQQLNHKNEETVQDFNVCMQKCENKTSEIDEMLHLAYEKAKILTATIEECQVNIRYLREKLDLIFRNGCGSGGSKKYLILSKNFVKN